MSKHVTVLVEGNTEVEFIKLLATELSYKGIYLIPVQLSKKGKNGGDVKFCRAKNDIAENLKKRTDTWLTMMVDFYGIDSDWPGYAKAKEQTTHEQKAAVMKQATADAVKTLFPQWHTRFIPYVSMYETEALLFSDPELLATHLKVKPKQIEEIIKKAGEPEKINDSPDTAPSKRLLKLRPSYKKTITGITIAQAIGIPKMRAACPLFNAWVSELEK